MRRKRWFFGSFFLVCQLLLQTATFGQPFDLDPKKWFPLELESYWHYRPQPSDFIVDIVQKADRDSVIDGRRWVRIKNVFCSLPVNCSTETVRWYHFTEDHYLLITSPRPDIARADTVLPTQPRSFFTANVPADTLRSSRVSDPVTVQIRTHDAGSEADSTHLELFVTANFDIFFSDSFIYKVGRLRGNLVGAIVGDVSYGDTTLITSVALPIDDRPTLPEPADVQLDVYPNPAREAATVRVVSGRQGLYEVAIYNLLGQRVRKVEQWLAPNQEWRWVWTEAGRMSGNAYFIRVRRDDRVLSTKPVILVR